MVPIVSEDRLLFISLAKKKKVSPIGSPVGPITIDDETIWTSLIATTVCSALKSFISPNVNKILRTSPYSVPLAQFSPPVSFPFESYT